METARTIIVLGVTIFGLLSDHVLWAQPTSEPALTDRKQLANDETEPWNRSIPRATQDDAEVLFMEGNRLFRIPLFRQAAEQYAAALARWKHPAIYFNLGMAQLNLGEDVAARESLESALRYGARGLAYDDDPRSGVSQFEEGTKQLAALERKLGQIRITCQTPGAVITLDGVTLFTGPGTYQGWTQAKTHELGARARDYLSEARQIMVRAGAIERIELKLVTLSEATDRSRRWAIWKPWSVVGAGAAIAAGGGVFHVLSERTADRYEEEFLRLGCANDQTRPGCQGGQFPSELTDSLKRAEQQKTIAVGAYFVGGAVAVTGAVLLYANRPRLLERRTPSSSGRRVTMVPTLSVDMLGLFVRIE